MLKEIEVSTDACLDGRKRLRKWLPEEQRSSHAQPATFHPRSSERAVAKQEKSPPFLCTYDAISLASPVSLLTT
eukprot:1159313-Pelagomonas_calceolata.AAC.7